MNYTGLNFTSGSKLTAESLNIMNNKINELVRAINAMQKDHVNVNIEIIGADTEMSLTTAINQIPNERRETGISVKFNELGRSGWSTYVWDGSNWENTAAWTRISDDLDVLDGGEVY